MSTTAITPIFMSKVTRLIALVTLPLALGACVSRATYQQTQAEVTALTGQIELLLKERDTLHARNNRCEENCLECEQALAAERTLGNDRQQSLERARQDLERLERIIGERDQETGRGLADLRQIVEALRVENQRLQEQLLVPPPSVNP